MNPPSLPRRALAEFLGTGLLVAVVVGSGIAAERLSADPGLRLLENSIATTLGLAALIMLLAPVSGAHFNPAVSLADTVLGRRRQTAAPMGLSLLSLGVYLAAQLLGGIAGALAANAMFQVPASIAATDRAGTGTVLAEVVATAGLVLLIAGMSRTGQSVPAIAAAVGAYIGAAYWFTSSTSFANPAVTIGRIFSDTFAGIAPASALPFVIAQLGGAAIGVLLTLALFPHSPAAIAAAPDPVTQTPVREDPS